MPGTPKSSPSQPSYGDFGAQQMLPFLFFFHLDDGVIYPFHFPHFNIFWPLCSYFCKVVAFIIYLPPLVQRLGWSKGHPYLMALSNIYLIFIFQILESKITLVLRQYFSVIKIGVGL